MNRIEFFRGLALALFLSPVATLAAPASVQMCAACHGARGEGNAQTGVPLIAGQIQAYLERQLAAFANGRRESRTMSPIAGALSPEERAAVAAYYATLNAPQREPRN